MRQLVPEVAYRFIASPTFSVVQYPVFLPNPYSSSFLMIFFMDQMISDTNSMPDPGIGAFLGISYSKLYF